MMIGASNHLLPLPLSILRRCAEFPKMGASRPQIGNNHGWSTCRPPTKPNPLVSLNKARLWNPGLINLGWVCWMFWGGRLTSHETKGVWPFPYVPPPKTNMAIAGRSPWIWYRRYIFKWLFCPAFRSVTPVNSIEFQRKKSTYPTGFRGERNLAGQRRCDAQPQWLIHGTNDIFTYMGRIWFLMVNRVVGLGLESQPNPGGFHYLDPAWYHLWFVSEHVHGRNLQPG